MVCQCLFVKIAVEQDAPEPEKFNAILAKIQPPVGALPNLVILIVIVPWRAEASAKAARNYNHNRTSSHQHPTFNSDRSQAGICAARSECRPPARRVSDSGNIQHRTTNIQ
jgi:hypothetical protein